MRPVEIGSLTFDDAEVNIEIHRRHDLIATLLFGQNPASTSGSAGFSTST
jgi:hypothetical protein